MDWIMTFLFGPDEREILLERVNNLKKEINDLNNLDLPDRINQNLVLVEKHKILSGETSKYRCKVEMENETEEERIIKKNN